MDEASRAQIDEDAEKIYDYLRMNMPLPATTVDAIFCLCSLDLRVAHRAAQLFLEGYGRYLIFSGGSGKLTANRAEFRDAPEAVVFARIAMERGVPEDKIIVEPRSTNTGENVRFTFELLQQKGFLTQRSLQDDYSGGIRSFILVQKPYMERRTYATFMKQWPGMADGKDGARPFEFSVTSPQFSFAEYLDDDNPRELVINIMVGDLVRIRSYPAMGYQIAQDVPEEIWEAGQRLLAAGFNRHMPS